MMSRMSLRLQVENQVDATRRWLEPKDSSEKERFMFKLSTRKFRLKSRGNSGKHRGSSYMRAYSRRIKKDQVHRFTKMKVVQVNSMRKFQRREKISNVERYFCNFSKYLLQAKTPSTG